MGILCLSHSPLLRVSVRTPAGYLGLHTLTVFSFKGSRPTWHIVLINNLLIMCHVGLCSLVGLGPTMVEPDLLIPIYAYVACFHYHLILNFNLAFAIEYSKFEFMICTPRLISGAVLQCRPSRTGAWIQINGTKGAPPYGIVIDCLHLSLSFWWPPSRCRYNGVGLSPKNDF